MIQAGLALTHRYMPEFKLFEFVVKTTYDTECSPGEYVPPNEGVFTIQMFGINEQGETASIMIYDFAPFFYIKVPNHWTSIHKKQLKTYLLRRMGRGYENTVAKTSIVQRKTLYGFNAGELSSFVKVTFTNIRAFNCAKNMWYIDDSTNEDFSRTLNPQGLVFNGEPLYIYESNIPPLLRFFHIQKISPSGWITFSVFRENVHSKTTTCTYEYDVGYADIVPLPDKNTSVPYKIMSFDIEASSSHGDFPVPVKTYKKLAYEIVHLWLNNITEPAAVSKIISDGIHQAFYNPIELSRVYPKRLPCPDDLNASIDALINMKRAASSMQPLADMTQLRGRIETYFGQSDCKNSESLNPADEDDNDDDDDDDREDADANDGLSAELNYTMNETTATSLFDIAPTRHTAGSKKANKSDMTFIESLLKATDISEKVQMLTDAMDAHLPALNGDKVTFIGSVFYRNGEPDAYLNHCIALNSCSNVDGAEIESYPSESEVLLAWTRLVQRENPDIIIGYNTSGFDYLFMFCRAQECECIDDFLMLSRNMHEICAQEDRRTHAWTLETSKLVVASGEYTLSNIHMPGRLHVDMLTWFRRTENLDSYKLDNVAARTIGDWIVKIEHVLERDVTRLYTKNMRGLQIGNFIKLEEHSHTTVLYKNAVSQKNKFCVVSMSKSEGWFEISGKEEPGNVKLKWGMAKDDITPKDIFRMTQEGPDSRAVIAKYCIQDCALVYHLFSKIDVMTDMIEMARLCCVPMSYLITRGQGIRLTSYVAKKCMEKNVLMSVLNKGAKEDAYEGAIVLDPVCGLYLNDAIAVGDFASLYPSSILSENLCPSSKVSTKSYSLTDELISETGDPRYDNLPGYEYVDIAFDTYVYKTGPNGKPVKTCTGKKICRFASSQTGERAVIPAILEELIKARKDIRKLIPRQTDEFMKNILDKRQNACKVVANSTYGLLGAKTSIFYEPDIAAATTATGRMCLTYAKEVLTQCYRETQVTLKDGQTFVATIEHIYGDTDSVFFKFALNTLEGKAIEGKQLLEYTIELAQEACHLVSKFLKRPHDFEYEKTFYPFCILSKKRYIGIKYEFDTAKSTRVAMGMVLKRRDNAPIVKDICGGIVDTLLIRRNVAEAIQFLHCELDKLARGRVDIKKLIISKSLRSFYVHPTRIAHYVLAQRMAQRDPGNKPMPGDRIPYVHILPKRNHTNKTILQGDKIETPAYIADPSTYTRIDYEYYITNQVMQPILQIFSLVLPTLLSAGEYKTFTEKVQMLIKKAKMAKTENTEKNAKAEKTLATAITKLKYSKTKEKLFDTHIRDARICVLGNESIYNCFSKLTT